MISETFVSKCQKCRRCKLCNTRRQVVVGRGIGSAPADVLFIGEAPGKSEDLRGEPFIGPAGRVLTSAIEDSLLRAKVSADDISYYITNTVFCRPTDEPRGANREPSDEEIRLCRPNVLGLMNLINPTSIILLGKVAQKAMLAAYPHAICLHHPAYILRKGGTLSAEYRTFVRNITDVFKAKTERSFLGRKVKC